MQTDLDNYINKKKGLISILQKILLEEKKKE